MEQNNNEPKSTTKQSKHEVILSLTIHLPVEQLRKKEKSKTKNKVNNENKQTMVLLFIDDLPAHWALSKGWKNLIFTSSFSLWLNETLGVADSERLCLSTREPVERLEDKGGDSAVKQSIWRRSETSIDTTMKLITKTQWNNWKLWNKINQKTTTTTNHLKAHRKVSKDWWLKELDFQDSPHHNSVRHREFLIHWKTFLEAQGGDSLFDKQSGKDQRHRSTYSSRNRIRSRHTSSARRKKRKKSS